MAWHKEVCEQWGRVTRMGTSPRPLGHQVMVTVPSSCQAAVSIVAGLLGPFTTVP